MPNPSDPVLLSRRKAAIWVASFGFGTLASAAGVEPASVSEPKRSKLGLYVEARDVPAFFEAQGGPSKVLFIDVRTRAEAMFVGMSPAGRRDVNGWRMAGLPWSYELDKSKMYLPR